MSGDPTSQDLLPWAWVPRGPPVIVGESSRHNLDFQNEPRTLPIWRFAQSRRRYPSDTSLRHGVCAERDAARNCACDRGLFARIRFNGFSDVGQSGCSRCDAGSARHHCCYWTALQFDGRDCELCPIRTSIQRKNIGSRFSDDRNRRRLFLSWPTCWRSSRRRLPYRVRILNISTTAGYIASAIGLVLLAYFMYRMGQELLRWAPPEFGRVKAVACTTLAP